MTNKERIEHLETLTKRLDSRIGQIRRQMVKLLGAEDRAAELSDRANQLWGELQNLMAMVLIHQQPRIDAFDGWSEGLRRFYDEWQTSSCDGRHCEQCPPQARAACKLVSSLIEQSKAFARDKAAGGQRAPRMDSQAGSECHCIACELRAAMRKRGLRPIEPGHS